MLSLIKIKDIHQCEDTDHVMLLSKQARGRPGSRRHHVGFPCFRVT